MCGNPAVPFVVGFPSGKPQAYVFKADCDNWTCPECAERKKRLWVARAVSGYKKHISSGTAVQFVTITSHKSLKDSAATIAVFPNAWGKLYNRMKYKAPTMEYLMVIEAHKNGRIHAHMMTTAPMNKRWYKDNCSKCGLGYMADVQPIHDGGGAAWYVSKYLGKSLEGMNLPAKMRRVKCSQGWYDDTPPDDTLPDGVEWMTFTTKEGLLRAVDMCRLEGRTMVNPKTGEVFDYLEACETWYQ